MSFGLAEEIFQMLFAFGLGLAPISEVRGAAIYAIVQARNDWLILFGIAGNIAAAFLLVFLWDHLHIEKIGRRIMGGRLEHKLHDFEKKYETAGTVGLALFIGAPLPLTGVYTGVLLAKIIGIPDRKILLASTAGVLIASSITYLVLKGLLSIPFLL
ncbi:MAG: small multi-drug export protein [Candidatus Micrarchaeota archaeon]|nr:small multi-drug export protein [Candidatus Micrarchaeota archaeon]